MKLSKNAAKPLKLNFWGLVVLAAPPRRGEMRPNYFQYTQPVCKVDVAYNTIIKIESGATYNPRVETLKQIADALGVGIDDLMK